MIFTVETGIKNKERREYYVEGVKELFGKKIISSKDFFIGGKMANDYDIFFGYQNILTEGTFLEIDYVLGGHRQYFKLNCEVFSDSEEMINKLESGIKKLCGVKNGQ